MKKSVFPFTCAVYAVNGVKMFFPVRLSWDFAVSSLLVQTIQRFEMKSEETLCAASSGRFALVSRSNESLC